MTQEVTAFILLVLGLVMLTGGVFLLSHAMTTLIRNVRLEQLKETKKAPPEETPRFRKSA